MNKITIYYPCNSKELSEQFLIKRLLKSELITRDELNKYFEIVFDYNSNIDLFNEGKIHIFLELLFDIFHTR